MSDADKPNGETVVNMALRDWFAGMAPDGCLSFVGDFEFSEPEPTKPDGYDYFRRGGSAERERLAEVAEKYERELTAWNARKHRAMFVACRYAYADAMLTERQRRQAT